MAYPLIFLTYPYAYLRLGTAAILTIKLKITQENVLKKEIGFWFLNESLKC